MNSTQSFEWNGNVFWSGTILENLQPAFLSSDNCMLYADAPPTLFTSLHETQKKYPKNHCIVDDSGISYTYTHFFKLVEDFAKVLFYTYNVRSGSQVGLLLHNSIEFCVSFYAINRLNAVVVPLSTKYKKTEIFSLIEKVDLKGIIYEKEYSEWFEKGCSLSLQFSISIDSDLLDHSLPPGLSNTLLPDITASPEDTAITMFTSGTTSQSKGVLLTNYNTMHSVWVYKKIFNITDSDRTLIPVPIYHITGLLALLGLFIASGGCIYLHKAFNARRVLEDIEHKQITFLHAAPTVYSRLLEHKCEYINLPSLRLMACGSSNMPTPKISELKTWIPNAQFRTVYGLTETSSPATIFPEDAAASPFIGSSGCPIPGTFFKICNDEGLSFPANKVGSILIKGSVVSPGYLTDRMIITENGWLDTGDIGYFNEHGYLYIVDRKKDMINRGGEKIYSIDVEDTLYTIPGILEAAVVGISDDTYGELAAAMVTLDKGSLLTEEEIREVLKSKLAKFQIPVKFFITDRIPLTPNSKVDKKRIRQLLSQNN